MSTQSLRATTASKDFNDRYAGLLAAVLLGYAVLGKGFAYVGVAPLFVGEIALVLGSVAFLRSGCFIAVFATLPGLMAAALMVWVTVRTAPYVAVHGVDALRDSVVATYGAFAFIVVALLLEKRERILVVARWLGSFTYLYGPSAFGLYYISKLGRDVWPQWPGSNVGIFFLRPGEVAVHLSAAVVVAICGMRRVGLAWSLFVLFGIFFVSAQSRGGMLAIVLPAVLALIITGQGKVAGVSTGLLVAVLTFAYVLDLRIELPPDHRSFSAEQVFENLASLVSQGSDAQLDGTKAWRVRWWEAIQGYTLHGEYFWTGKGFGVNLAEIDGFMVGLEHGGPPLRSPHNVHMTILARAGVPGLVLWILLGASWSLMLLKNYVAARHRSERAWANLFLVLLCYVAAIVVNASFDVALEGPMLGIWFWTLIGLGIGASMVYRAPGPRLDPVAE